MLLKHEGKRGPVSIPKKKHEGKRIIKKKERLNNDDKEGKRW